MSQRAETKDHLLLDCASRELKLSEAAIMGVLNVTPDSFFDGGRYTTPSAAVEQAGIMVDHGAAIIDVGGESTRPGASPVSVATEIGRVVPIISALRDQLSIPISCDTRRPEVMSEAVAAGAGMINDVAALTADGALETVAGLKVPVCLMHMRGVPATMQNGPAYADVVKEVVDYLASRAAAAIAAGILADQILLDPGIGFGKSLDHNLALIRNLPRLAALGHGIVIGLSRKSMFGALLDLPVEQRLPASLAAAAVSVCQGANLIRTHDVKATFEAIKVATAIARQPVF